MTDVDRKTKSKNIVVRCLRPYKGYGLLRESPVWGCTGGEVHNDMRLCLLCPIAQLALCGDVLEVKFIMT